MVLLVCYGFNFGTCVAELFFSNFLMREKKCHCNVLSNDYNPDRPMSSSLNGPSPCKTKVEGKVLGSRLTGCM